MGNGKWKMVYKRRIESKICNVENRKCNLKFIKGVQLSYPQKYPKM